MSKNLKRGDVVYVDLRGAEGSEIQKVRPCVVVQNDTGNKHAPHTIVVPLTDDDGTKTLPVHVKVPASELAPGGKDSIAKCEHVRTVDIAARIGQPHGRLSEATLARLNRALAISLGLDESGGAG